VHDPAVMPELSLYLPIRRIARPARIGIRESDYAAAVVPVEVPLSGCALVLVDVWDRHHIASHAERTDAVVRAVLAPLLATARRTGLRVVHAPGLAAARHHPQAHCEGARERWVGPERDPEWPPGPVAWTSDAVEPEVAELRASRRIHPLCEPQGDEPVVADGEQLHAVLMAERRRVLFFAGFAANLCVLNRDYGMRAFHARGYAAVLVRDATVAIESAETEPRGALLEAAVAEAEMSFSGTLSSGELARALEESVRLGSRDR